MKIITIELTGATDAAGTLGHFYYSTGNFVTLPSDTPANTSFNPAIIDAGTLGLHVFSDGSTGGGTKLETGDIILANSDGGLDALINYSFDGRAVIIRTGDSAGAYPSSFSKIFTGTISSIESTWETIIIHIRDKQFVFDLPVLTTVYAGNNSLPNGLEGTATDLQGKVKPRTYGKVFNVPPAFINTSKLTYQVSDGALNDIPAVYDRGLLITKGADYANSTLLQAAAPGAGTYITCFAEGMFRLGSTPAGTITADVTQGANAAARTVAQIVNSLALSAGLSSGEISSGDITALDTANSSVVGIYINDTSTFQSALDELLGSVGGYCGFDSLGVLRTGVLLAPTGTAVATLQEYDIIENPNKIVPKDNGIPIYRMTVNHTKIYTVQGSDLAGAVTTPTRAYLTSAYRSVKSEDTSIKTQWLLAGTYEISTLLTSATDASTEADRQLAIYKVRKDIYEISCDMSIFTLNSLKLMDVITLTVARYGMTGGQKFRLIGYRLELSTGKVILSLWG